MWKAGLAAGGYGNVWDGERNRKAHVLSYEMHVGPVPEGNEIDHICRVRRCVNPAHLEAVPHVENVNRGDSGLHHAVKTHCPKGHPYSGQNLTVKADGRRRCKICHGEQVRRSDATYMDRWARKVLGERNAKP